MLARIASGTAEGTRPVARQAAEATGDAVTEIQARGLITALDEVGEDGVDAMPDAAGYTIVGTWPPP